MGVENTEMLVFKCNVREEVCVSRELTKRVGFVSSYFKRFIEGSFATCGRPGLE